MQQPLSRSLVAAAAATITLLLGACATPASRADNSTLGHAALALADGTRAGSVQLVKEGDELVLLVSVDGIAAGMHGFHLHMVGKCEGPGFTSAGGHLNPYARNHGSLDPDGSHLGDMPNLAVESGHAAISLRLDNAGGRTLDKIFDADGTAVVIHAAPDDYRSQPSGNAGARIACGVLVRG